MIGLLIRSLSAVVGGFLSPSHDDYVFGKLGNQAIEAEHRLAMAERALTSSTWISLEPWEATIPGFVNFHSVRARARGRLLLRSLIATSPQVVIEFDRFIKKSLPSYPIQVMYLCGADLIIRCRFFTSLGPFPVVRTNEREPGASLESLSRSPAGRDRTPWLLERDQAKTLC
jgi:hypothetical protein